ncbi:MAG: hypothetical protein COA97_05020 [Flavobacteriales bacterium]|nr:MAG: hypothetical protein COA97_05020 [Flavobacteriales bacterium]
MKKNQIKAILKGESIIDGLTIHPSIFEKQISEETNKLVKRIASYNWFSHLRKHGLVAKMNPYPNRVYRKEGWKGWIDFMGYERLLYEVEELKRRWGDDKQFLIIARKFYMTNDLYEALALYFMRSYIPNVYVIENNGDKFLQILGSDIDGTLSYEQIQEKIDNYKQAITNTKK